MNVGHGENLFKSALSIVENNTRKYSWGAHVFEHGCSYAVKHKEVRKRSNCTLGSCSVFVPDATLPIPSMESSCVALPSPVHGLGRFFIIFLPCPLDNCSCIVLPSAILGFVISLYPCTLTVNFLLLSIS